MRFLHIALDGRLTLTKDLTSPPGPYAILSHTWGSDEDEVTFDDLEKKTGHNKWGYKKLAFTVEQAKIDGLEYCWVDTCCINKANLVELDEAIRSMFRWYRDAARCYVYLSDVSLYKRHDQNTRHDQKTRTWKSDFRQSRWFTRIWTLQDLLAPRSVQFFSQEGQSLGTKTSLELEIHEITGIPVAALRGTPLSQFSIEERLQWAAGRLSKKVEDKAYGLLGIFGISMSLRYGEGENAFRRLKEKLSKQGQRVNDADEVNSILSVDGSVATGSSATLIGEALEGANEFITIILRDQELNPLLSASFQRVEPGKLERNLKRLLKHYAVDLGKIAMTVVEKEAVQLVRTRSAYIANRIRQHYDPSAEEDPAWSTKLLSMESGNRPLLQRYLSGKTGNYVDSTGIEPQNDSVEDGSASSTSDWAENEHPELDDLSRVRDFMLNSAAYRDFKERFRLFVDPELSLRNTTTPLPREAYLQRSWSAFRNKCTETRNALRILMRPPVSHAYQRITWICGCGEQRYADIRESRSGGALRLQRLLRSSAATTEPSHANNTRSNSLESPAPHFQGSSSMNLSPDSRLVHSRHQTNATPKASDMSTISKSTTATAAAFHVFLLLCVTIRGSSWLQQLNVTNITNDQPLWEAIRQQYHTLRKATIWHQKNSATKWLASCTWLKRIFAATELTSATSIEFVRFQLVPVAMEYRPWCFQSPLIPPEEEVKINRPIPIFLVLSNMS